MNSGNAGLKTRATGRVANGPIVRAFRNLVAIPSRHYDGVYGRAVHEVFADAQPDAIALELPLCFLPELEWALTCWPGPVAALSEGSILPFVAGDSINEAFRLGRQAGTSIALIDVDVAGRDKRPWVQLPGTELARRVGAPFFEVASGLLQDVPPTPNDLAREAAMARELARLMKEHRSVLWVGGVGHWQRLVARIEAGDFEAAEVPLRGPRTFERARLAPSALVRITQQYPWTLQRFAKSPRTFDPVAAVPALLHEAAHPRLDGRGQPPESRSAVDLARVGLYARNLAATIGMSDLPTLADLLLAAQATIGARYASRLYLVAMTEHTTRASQAAPGLSWRINRKATHTGLRFKRRWLVTEPWFPSERPLLELPDLTAIRRAARDAHYEALPGPRAGDRYFWGAYPPDEAEYEMFVQYLLRRASILDPEEARSVPFSNGLADGIDVRATIRHWVEDTIYVREEQRGRMNVTNGVIDWTSADEGSEVLQGRTPHGGWNDPDCLHIGSCSREVGDSELVFRRGESEGRVRQRQWSLISLDCPTSLRNPAGRRTFFDRVIEGLLAIQGRRPADDVYGWLGVMCRFCAGKPLVYYSRYRPGPRLFAIARAHDVALVWSPLGRVPRELLERHRTFRQLWLAESQWETLKERLTGAETGQPDFARLLG
ncbi:MAG: hypothetical protein H6Q86_2435 [candidate division NC10 bacterium]|nr:hypothetical protein [candidate division NC10 bacterium]